MGRLAGFSYSEVARRLRRLGFEFDRQAKGSHEIWRHGDEVRVGLLAQPAYEWMLEGAAKG